MKVIHLNRSSKATRWLDVKQQLWWSPVFHLVSGRKPLGHQVKVVVAEGRGASTGQWDMLTKIWSGVWFWPKVLSGEQLLPKGCNQSSLCWFERLKASRETAGTDVAGQSFCSDEDQSHCTGIYCDCHVFTQYQHLACINYWQSEYVIVIRGGRLFFRQDVAPCNINTNLQGSLFTF